MIWSKTDAGRSEMQSRALVKDRAQRNLLLVIDGVKDDQMLLAGMAGVTAADLQTLHALGLIEPAPANPSGRNGPAGSRSGNAAASAAPSTEAAAAATPTDYAEFSAVLTQMISRELGLRGFMLTLAVEKAGTIEEMRAVADRVLAQIVERKGDAAGAAARRSLYGD